MSDFVSKNIFSEILLKSKTLISMCFELSLKRFIHSFSNLKTYQMLNWLVKYIFAVCEE